MHPTTRMMAFLPTIIVTIAALLAGYAVLVLDRNIAEKAAMVRATERLELIRADLENDIEQWSALLSSIGRFAAQPTDLSQGAYEQIIKRSVPKSRIYRNIAWAPNLVIQHTFPLAGNEQVIGLDYRDVPEQFDEVSLAQSSGKFTVSGPVDLVQGGKGIILRMPITTLESDLPVFHGLMSVVLPVDQFLLKGRMTVGADEGVKLAVAAGPRQGQTDTFMAGDPTAITPAALRTGITFSNTRWSVFIAPKTTWQATSFAQSARSTPVNVAVVLLILIVPIVTFVANHMSEARQRTLLDVRATNQRLKSIMNNAPGGFISYRANADSTCQIDFATEACSQLFEIDLVSIVSNPTEILELTDPSHRRSLLKSLKTATADFFPWHHEWKIQTPQGNIKWLEGWGSPTRIADGTIVYDSLVVDVTDGYLRQEEIKRQSSIAAEAQKQEVIGQFTGGVAHDFNNLLAVILGNLEILKDELEAEGNVASEQLAYIQQALKASQRGADLTRKMLSFARRSKPTLAPTDLSTVVSELGAWTRRTLPETIDVVIEKPEVLPKVYVDETSAESALLNLIVNARDAMPGGGTLTIKTALEVLAKPQAETAPETSEAFVVLSVADTGVGISSDQMERIFQPFFTTKASGKGTGLGLLMVKAFVTHSGGFARVISKPDMGATFKLYFPVKNTRDASDDDLESVDMSPETPETQERLRVLLAEDEHDVRAVIKRMLERLGHTVVAAASGDEAFEMFCNSGPFDLVLTDMVMTGKLQGAGLVDELRKRSDTVSVIVMSGYAGTNTRPMGEVWLPKPIRRADLEKAIHAARKNR